MPECESRAKHIQSVMISLHPLKELWRNLLKKSSYILRSNQNVTDMILSFMTTFLPVHSFVPMLKDLISKGKSCVTKLMTTDMFFLMHRIILRRASGTQYWKVFVCLTPPTENISSLASKHFFHSLFPKCLKRLMLPEIIDNSGHVSIENVATTEFCYLLSRCHSRPMIFPFCPLTCSPSLTASRRYGMME